MRPINTKLLGCRIKIFMRKYNYNYAQLSKLWGISHENISNWVRDKCAPNIKAYNYIMKYLETHS